MFIIAAASPEAPFTDVTTAVGIDFKHENSATSSKYLVETMGGGVAMLDYDRDGRLDLFFTNGANIGDPMPDGKLPDKSDRKFWNRLYRQREDGTFVDVTEQAGLTGMPQNYYGMGVAVGDYDNDGFEDLYVTNYGANTLYHNNRNGTFTDVTRAAGVVRRGQRRQARSVRDPIREVELSEQQVLRGKEARAPCLLSPRQLRRDRQHPVSQQRRRHVHRCILEGRSRQLQRQGTRAVIRRLRR
ncbi:MAG: hypothetical protein DMF98_16220 [Acidobacteria bacterium]|nr:MAG: hypothetical protein DMF98_16220 [Acidobacteriota bacterium]